MFESIIYLCRTLLQITSDESLVIVIKVIKLWSSEWGQKLTRPGKRTSITNTSTWLKINPINSLLRNSQKLFDQSETRKLQEFIEAQANANLPGNRMMNVSTTTEVDLISGLLKDIQRWFNQSEIRKKRAISQATHQFNIVKRNSLSIYVSLIVLQLSFSGMNCMVVSKLRSAKHVLTQIWEWIMVLRRQNWNIVIWEK